MIYLTQSKVLCDSRYVTPSMDSSKGCMNPANEFALHDDDDKRWEKKILATKFNKCSDYLSISNHFSSIPLSSIPSYYSENVGGMMDANQSSMHRRRRSELEGEEGGDRPRSCPLTLSVVCASNEGWLDSDSIINNAWIMPFSLQTSSLWGNKNWPPSIKVKKL